MNMTDIVGQVMRERGMSRPVVGMANGGGVRPRLGMADTAARPTVGLIPGTVDPTVADDTTLKLPSGAEGNFKIGEYIIPQEVVAALGTQKLDKLVLDTKKKLGLPLEMGPKTHDMPDSQGRMDKPGLPMGNMGHAKGGPTWEPPYETSPVEIAKENPIKSVLTLGAAPLLASAGGFVGNVASAMGADTDSMAMVKGRTQDVAGQLGTASKNISQPAAASVQALTGQTITGNQPVEYIPPTTKQGTKLGWTTGNNKTAMDFINDNPQTVKSPLGYQGGTAPDPAKLGQQVYTGPEFATATGGMGLIGSPRQYKTPTVTVGNTTSSANDWSDGSANMVKMGIESKYNDEVAAATRNNAITANFEANKSAAQRFNDLSSGNTTWDMKPEEKMKLALGSFAADKKTQADNTVANTTQQGQRLGLQGDMYKADQSLAGNKIVAEEGAKSRMYGADQARLGREYEAQQKALYTPNKAESAKISADGKREERIIAGRAALMAKPEWYTLSPEQQADALNLLELDSSKETWVAGTPAQEAKSPWLGPNTPAVAAKAGRRVPKVDPDKVASQHYTPAEIAAYKKSKGIV